MTNDQIVYTIVYTIYYILSASLEDYYTPSKSLCQVSIPVLYGRYRNILHEACRFGSSCVINAMNKCCGFNALWCCIYAITGRCVRAARIQGYGGVRSSRALATYRLRDLHYARMQTQKNPTAFLRWGELARLGQ